MKNTKVKASFYYGNEKMVLNPEEMTVISKGIYSKELGDGLEAVLEYNEPAPDAFISLLRFKNKGVHNSKQIKAPKTLDMTVEKSGHPIIWHSINGDSCGENSFMPLTRTLKVGEAHHAQPLGGRSSNTSAFPYFDISYGSHSMICAVGWSGEWCEDITVMDDSFNIQAGICDADFYLKPDEEVRCPSVFVMFGEDTEKLHRDFRRLHMEQFSPKTRFGKEMMLPVAISPFDRYFQGLGNSLKISGWASEDGQLKTLNASLKCGYIDTFWFDAGWFKDGFPSGVGNYSFTDGFPHGLRNLSDAVHSHDLKMLLWFEPERVYKGSEVDREHPEMLLHSSSDPNQRLFNLGDEKARKWLTDTLVHFIIDNGIDIYRQDFNMDPLPYWKEADEENRHGITEMKYIEGLYTLWDSLIEKFPKMLIDNCASGGRRIDFETCKRAVPLWRSDINCLPESKDHRTSVWNTNQVLGLMNYLPYHSAGVWETDAYDFRAASSMGISCDLDIFNKNFNFEASRKCLKEMQCFKHYWEGDFYPLTQATNDESVWAAYQLSLNDSGIAYFFRRESSETNRMIFKMNAVKPDLNYRVCMTDEFMNNNIYTISGKQLLKGIEITIPNKRNSLILQYTKE